jgi:hypothetical protein
MRRGNCSGDGVTSHFWCSFRLHFCEFPPPRPFRLVRLSSDWDRVYFVCSCRPTANQRGLTPFILFPFSAFTWCMRAHICLPIPILLFTHKAQSNGARPACTPANRGDFYLNTDGAGLNDELYICVLVAGAMSWREATLTAI